MPRDRTGCPYGAARTAPSSSDGSRQAPGMPDSTILGGVRKVTAAQERQRPAQELQVASGQSQPKAPAVTRPYTRPSNMNLSVMLQRWPFHMESTIGLTA